MQPEPKIWRYAAIWESFGYAPLTRNGILGLAAEDTPAGTYMVPIVEGKGMDAVLKFYAESTVDSWVGAARIKADSSVGDLLSRANEQSWVNTIRDPNQAFPS